jgi:two-component system NarL family sensor kinase
VSNGPMVEPLAAAVARLITDATTTDVCFVHVLDDTERSLTLAGATPPFDSEVGKIRLPLGQGISGWVASHREPVVIRDDKESDPRYLPFQSLRGRDFTSMVSVPMETAPPGGLVGVLNVHTVARREFGDRDVEMLLVIGRLIAGAMHQARLHRQLVARERAHENFVEQVIEAQELERRRLAGDIHDGISQRLVTLSYRLDAAAQSVDDRVALTEQLDRARELIDLTLQEARAAISGLRPPVLDDLGLSGGLASLARSIPQVGIDLEIGPDLADTRLPDHIELALYRIAQECLQNVVKHAKATRARLTFTVERGDHGEIARLDIVDDGIGFDTLEHPLGSDEMGGYGLLSMAERAEIVGGRLNIRSRPGTGTAVTATIPIPSAK